MVLSFSASGNRSGYDISSQRFFAQLAALGRANTGAPKRSSIAEARAKLDHEAFRFLLSRFSEKASTKRWKGHRILAVDGSRIRLPRTSSILSEFPIQYGAHYPQALLVTAVDVLKGVVCGTHLASSYASERGQLEEMSSELKPHDLLLLDRGYDGFRTWASLAQRQLQFISRTRPAVSYQSKEFLKSGLKEQQVELSRGDHKLTVRYIRAGQDYLGQPFVLVTNLTDKKRYSRAEIIRTYKLRWKIETSYFRLKEQLKVEKFHGRTLNSVKQEIWAGLLVLSMASELAFKAQAELNGAHLKYVSIKNAIEVISTNLAYFIWQFWRWRKWLSALIDQIKSITYTHQPGRKNPRISKQPHTTWVRGRKNKCTERFKKKRGYL